MRSKKPRRIVVGDQEYFWSAKQGDDYPSVLQIYKDKKVIFKQILRERAVTPKIVADIIKIVDQRDLYSPHPCPLCGDSKPVMYDTIYIHCGNSECKLSYDSFTRDEWEKISEPIK